MKNIKDKLLQRKLNKTIKKTYECVYKLPFIKNNNQFNIESSVDGNNIFVDLSIYVDSLYQEQICYDVWNKYNWKLNMSLLFNMYVFMNIKYKK